MSDYQIVTVNVFQQVGETPSKLQQTGALVSTGATALNAGSTALIQQMSDLTALVNQPVTALAVNAGLLTMTLADALPNTVNVGDQLGVSLVDALPSGYNGSYTTTVVDSTTLTTPFALTLAPASQLGFIQLPQAKELLAMGTTFFAQGSSQAVNVLELGKADTAADSIAALATYLDDPTTRFYAYLLPKAWDGEPSMTALASNHAANEAQVYFFVTTQAGPVNLYHGIKSVVAMVQDVNAPDTEFTTAALLWNLLSARPSDINKVPPMAFRYLRGVTTYSGSGVAKSQLAENSINYVGTGAEGGISNTLVIKGVSCDGNDLTYWYSVDWVQINVHMALANAVINGSNTAINPLYYNPDGIARLQLAAQQQFNSGVSYGLVSGAPQVQAVSYRQYITDNPNDYALGRYAGLSATYTPARGFTSIIFNINVTLQPA